MSRKEDTRVADVIEKIRHLRVLKKISIEELATRANLSRSYIYYIESKKKIPTLTVLFRLADAMDADIEDLFGSSTGRQREYKAAVNRKMEDIHNNVPSFFKILSFVNTYQRKISGPDNLSLKELYLLLFVKQNGSGSISSLAADLDMPVLDVSRMVADLKSRNILQKKVKSSDRRMVLSSLTDTGLMLLEKNERIFRTFFENESAVPLGTAGGTDNAEDCCSVSGRLKYCFTPVFNADDEIVDLESPDADQPFVCEGPKSRTAGCAALLSRAFYQHFSIILSACNTVWKTRECVNRIFYTGSNGKGYICEFSRADGCIVVSAKPIRKASSRSRHELFPHYNYFFFSRPAKIVVECATGRILEVNKEAVRFYGWSRQQFLRKTIYEISTSRPEVIRLRLASGGENGDGAEEMFHAVHRLADGNMKELEVQILSCMRGETRIQYVTVIQDASVGTELFPCDDKNNMNEKGRYEDFQVFASKYENDITGVNGLFNYLRDNGKSCCCSAGDHFFEYGTLQPTFGFILNGVFRVYYGTLSGHEYTLEYLRSGDIIDSLTFSASSPEYEIIIEAVVPCKVLVIDQNLFRRRAAVDPHAFEFLYYLEKSRLRKLEKHAMLLLTDNAKERYEQFMHGESDFAEYLSGQDIASYLGITPETLSRIRNSD